MTVREAAAHLEVTPATVYALCAAGKLGHLRVGVGKGAIRITEADLATYVAACRVAPRDDEGRAAPPCRSRVVPRRQFRHIH